MSTGTRFIFRNTSRQWCLADTNGIELGLRSIDGDIRALDFNTAINLARHYSEQADDAEARGFAIAEEKWATWAEQLEIWAANYMPAPGQVVRQASEAITLNVRRTAVHACDQLPSFAEMTRRAG